MALWKSRAWTSATFARSKQENSARERKRNKRRRVKNSGHGGKNSRNFGSCPFGEWILDCTSTATAYPDPLVHRYYPPHSTPLLLYIQRAHTHRKSDSISLACLFPLFWCYLSMCGWLPLGWRHSPKKHRRRNKGMRIMERAGRCSCPLISLLMIHIL